MKSYFSKVSFKIIFFKYTLIKRQHQTFYFYRMKKIIFLSFLFLSALQLQAQINNHDEYDTTPPYKKYTTIPAFKILQTDSITWYTRADLPRKKPVVLVYFSPTCGHCQLETKAMVDSMSYLEKATIVFVSTHPLHELKPFEEKYEFAKFKNVHLGREVKYFIPSFFRVKYTPYVAIYNSKGQFVKSFEGGSKVIEIASLLK
jgi:thiol-disulfide isomerase/thioredoxin